MTKFERNYIGIGRRNAKVPAIVRFSFRLEDLQKIAYEKDSTMWVTVETAEMKQPDQFGRTHRAWVSELKEVEEKASKPPRKKTSSRK